MFGGFSFSAPTFAGLLGGYGILPDPVAAVQADLIEPPGGVVVMFPEGRAA